MMENALQTGHNALRGAVHHECRNERGRPTCGPENDGGAFRCDQCARWVGWCMGGSEPQNMGRCAECFHFTCDECGESAEGNYLIYPAKAEEAVTVLCDACGDRWPHGDAKGDSTHD